MGTTIQPVGSLLREWRQRRRMSQLDLACEAEISSKHLSFVETGRSIPSRDMVLHLAERLEVPLRERNMLLLAAGYAPIFPERRLDDPALAAARKAVDVILAGHEPYPAVAVDRHWTLVAANRAAAPVMAGIDPALLQPPVNAMRIALHPAGLAPRIVNLAEWRGHLLDRLRRQITVSADPVLLQLFTELRSYPAPDGSSVESSDQPAVVVPLRLATETGVLSFVSTITVFGTPVDITLAELALETFFPADPATAEALHRLARDAAPATQAVT
jgi:transcriptional regulator with XRE-family HTH domain